ncbi:GSCOCG00004312001-RA-CDS [Cotesia congregata]|uniref:Apolipoprotein D n=1 Tax=Cotesia congregata TaxID=51543 RepID=A0A8J2HSK4_COTCN|nr:GSCOCG00004312001-RA-CDS [Cotesia congregata]CAG5109094.1 Similar to Apod: Apolipoprotein D (Mus musculus) [Cotesia congregata]
MMFGLTIICCVTAAAYGQFFNLGRCPEPHTPFVLDFDRFAGKYYEIERSFNNWDEVGGKCPTSYYIQIPDNELLVIHSDISEITNMQSGLIGKATVNGAKLSIHYHSPIMGDKTRDVWVIDTDHDTFAILWACTNYGFIHVTYGWTLVKKSYINRDFSAQIQAAFKRAKIPLMSMRKVDHTNCP